jgi:hypothetical protein
MREFLTLFALAIPSWAFSADVDTDRLQRYLDGEYYKVTWRAAPIFDSTATLEIGEGYGHGGIHYWKRFVPSKEHVDVLCVEVDWGNVTFRSKWPPDKASATVKSARMKSEAYVCLLRDLALIHATKLKAFDPSRPGHIVSYFSSNDLWVNVTLDARKKQLIDLDWAGYECSLEEMKFAKPKAAIACVRDAISRITFKEHTLTERDKAWASAKFIRNWKKCENQDPAMPIGGCGIARSLPLD